MKVTLGLVMSSGFMVPAPFVIGYSHLLQTVLTGSGNALLPKAQAITTARVVFDQSFPVDYARNRVCKLFLDEDDGDYLLFLDADMVHPPDMVHRLVRHGRDLVTARYVMKKPPFFSVAMRQTGPRHTDFQSVEKLEPDLHGLVPVDAAGAGALLISRGVLQGIRARIGDDWFRYQDGPDGLRSISEDMWFFAQAKAAGFQAWLDADLVADHVATFQVNPKYHAPYAEAYSQAQARQQEAPV